MTKTRVIRVFSFIMALTLVFAMFTSPAYALRPQQFGAWVAAAIQAINITVGSTLVPAAELGQKFSDYLNYPVKINASQVIDIPYTFTDADIQAELDKSVIQIDKDSVTIDGVKYTDVWLSTNAAEKFRVNAFDIENAFDIASQSEGTFVSGFGESNGVPLYSSGNSVFSPTYTFSYPASVWNTTQESSFGIGNYDFLARTQTGYDYTVMWSRGVKLNTESSYGNTSFNGLNTNTLQLIRYDPGRYSWYNGNVRFGNFYSATEQPFDFDWTAGTIPVDQPLTDEGLRIRVPTDSINQWYTENPDIGPNVTINMGDPELSNKIDDLIDLIIPLIPVLDIDFTKQVAPDPDPEPEPIPDPDPYPDPLPDPDISLIDSTLKDIIQALKNIFDNISIGNSIISAIKNLADQIKWVLDDILDKIGDLVDKIVKGNIDWFSDLIDSIKKPFLPWLNIFKLGVNIWHYVVEWVQNISAPFSYFWNILGSISSIYYSPIYAVAAASIVIAIYRRFGK